MSVLYLLPAPIGDHFNLPENTSSLRRFIVENIRDGRRFLKACFPELNINECRFLEINKNQINAQEIQTFLQSAKKENEDIGLLSDAGLPCVADPGALVVEKAHHLNFQIKPLVGPSSLMLALMGSGFNGQCFAFHGYLPIAEPERSRSIRLLEEESLRRNMTQLFIETPYRNDKLLDLLLSLLKPTTRICIAWNLQTDEEQIQSMPAAAWKKNKPDLHKKPAVFLLYSR